jgi:hypothetical protein
MKIREFADYLTTDLKEGETLEGKLENYEKRFQVEN